jgi:hypothetical protein
MLTGWKTGHLTEGLVLHPLVLSDLADIAGVAFHGEATVEGFDGILAEAVQGTMHAARWGNGGRLLRPLSRAQSSWDIERALGRTQLAGLQRELVQRSRGETGRSGGIVGGSVGSRVGSRVGRRVGRRVGGRVGRRRLAIDRDLVGREVGRGQDMSSHDWWDVECKVRDDEMMRERNMKVKMFKVGEAGVMGRKPDSSEFMMNSGKTPRTFLWS